MDFLTSFLVAHEAAPPVPGGPVSVERLSGRVSQPLGVPPSPAEWSQGEETLRNSFYLNLCVQDSDEASLQLRLQASLVERLEDQVAEERTRLVSMLEHLQGRPDPGLRPPESRDIGDVTQEPETSEPLSVSAPGGRRPSQTYASMIRQVGQVIIQLWQWQ